MKKIRKAIIPAAGLGTRFLPATKAIAKELLPIVDKPTIQFIVEEAIESGIEDILIITSKAKRPVEDHFDVNLELEINLKEKGKIELLELVSKPTGVNLHFIRQNSAKGLGHAISLGKTFVGNEPFIVMLGDDLMSDEVTLTKQLMKAYEKTSCSVVAVTEVPYEETYKYGIISPKNEVEDNLFNVEKFVEKPNIEKTPSNMAIIGRYLLMPEIFDILEKQSPGAGGEIQLTDAINALNQTQQVFAHNFKGTRYDVGDKYEYLKTNIEYGLTHSEIKAQLKTYIIGLAQTLAN